MSWARVFAAVLAVVGIAMLVAWGLGAFLFYAGLVGFAAFLAWAAGAGGTWIQDVSRGRHDDRR